jgi:hypothetical protein
MISGGRSLRQCVNFLDNAVVKARKLHLLTARLSPLRESGLSVQTLCRLFTWPAAGKETDIDLFQIEQKGR